jgi:hypothetical protein
MSAGPKSATLAGGESTQMTFTIDVPTSAVPGMHTMEIASEDDTATREIMVNSLPNFEVDIVSIDDPVGVGENLDVTGKISNTGTLQGSQSVTLELGNGAASDTNDVTLDGETSTEKTFTVTTVNPAGAWTTTLSSANTSDTATALVLEFNLGFTPSTDGEAVARNSDDVTLDLEVSHTANPSNLDDQSVLTNVTLDPGSLESGTFSKEFTFDSSGSDTKTMTETFAPDYLGLGAGDYTVNASGSNTGATASTAVTVKKSDLEITSLSPPDSVTFGNDISVQTTVENQGNLNDMGRVQLVATNADGSDFIADGASFDLDGGDSSGPTLTFSSSDIVDAGYGEGDTVNFRVEVVNANTTDSRTGSVDLTDTGSGVISLGNSDTNSPVVEGESIEVTPTVDLPDILGTQSAGSLGTQDISTDALDLVLELDVTDENGNSIGNDSQDLTLNDLGNVLDPTLSVPTGQDDAGDYTATVELLGIIEVSDSADVTVESPNPNLEFDLTNAPNQLTIGSTSNLAVDYSVTNVGNADANTTINLFVDETTGSEDSAALNVAPGESAVGTLTYSDFADDYSAGETINWDVSLAQYGGSSSGTTDAAGDPASFDVSILGTNNPEAGNQLTVSVEVTNTGDQTGTVGVDMTIPNVGSKTTTMQDVTSSELRTHTFTFDTSSDDAGEYTATADTGDNTATTQVTIDGANIQIVSASANSAQVAPGDNLDIDYTLENVGTKEGTENFVDLKIQGSGTTYDDTDPDVTVPAGGTTSGTLTFSDTGSYSDGDTIDWTVELYDFDDSTSGNVGVDGSGGGGTASFAVNIQSTNSPVKEGNVLDVDVQVDNIGGAQGTQTINLNTGGLGIASTGVTLGAGESTTETLSVSTSNGDAGDYTASVSSEDTGDSTGVTVTTGTAPSQFNIQIDSIDGQDDPVVEVPDGGTTVDVAYTVENTGGKDGSTSVDIERNGNNVGSTSKTVPPGQTRSGTFSVDIGDSHISGNGIDIEVKTTDDSVSETIETKALRIDDHEVDDKVHPFLTEYLDNITTTVENIGSKQASDSLIADVQNSSSQTSKSITINPGDSREFDMNLEEDNFGSSGYIKARLGTYGDETLHQSPTTFDVRGDIWVEQGYIDQLNINDNSECGFLCLTVNVDFTLDVPWSGYIEDGFGRASGHAFRLVGDGSLGGDLGLTDTTAVRTEPNLGSNIQYTQTASELIGSNQNYQQFIHFFTDGNGNALEYEFPEITEFYYSDTSYCGISKDMTDYGNEEYGTPSDPGNGVDMGDAHILVTDSQGDSQCNDLLNKGGFFDP